MKGKPPFKRGQWVAEKEVNQPTLGKVHDCWFCEFDKVWVVDIIVYDWDGTLLGRVSPALDGPKRYEPACPADNYRVIQEPDFPVKRGLNGQYLSLKWADGTPTYNGNSL